MCEQCAAGLKKKECPTCRQPLSVKPSILARRMIGAMPLVCPNKCGTTSTVGNMSDHLVKCEKRKFYCSECDFEGVKAEFITHVIAKHEGELFSKFDKSLKKNQEEKFVNEVAQQMNQLNL